MFHALKSLLSDLGPTKIEEVLLQLIVKKHLIDDFRYFMICITTTYRHALEYDKTEDEEIEGEQEPVVAAAAVTVSEDFDGPMDSESILSPPVLDMKPLEQSLQRCFDDFL